MDKNSLLYFPRYLPPLLLFIYSWKVPEFLFLFLCSDFNFSFFFSKGVCNSLLEHFMIAALRSSSHSRVWVIIALGILRWFFLISVETLLVLEMMSNFALYLGHFRLWDSGFYLSCLLEHAGELLKFRMHVLSVLVGCGSNSNFVVKAFEVLFSLACLLVC